MSLGISKQGKDVDREILLKMYDRELLKYCHINQFMYTKVCDDNFFHRVLEQRYPDVLDVFEGNYKQQYLETVKWVAKLKEDFDYTYTGGDPDIQYGIFRQYGPNAPLGWILVEAARYEQLPVVKYLLDLDVGRPRQDEMNEALRYASRDGNLEMAKYLVSKGANIHENGEYPLHIAVTNDRLDMVKYLVSKGANIHENDDMIFETAREKDYVNILEYLESLP